MLVRIVKLTISPSHLDIFFKYFDEHKLKIAAFPGCKGMKLLKGISNSNLIMTYSHWENEEALNTYRESEIFTELWSKIKPLFCEKPEAWSQEVYFDGFLKKLS
ncbi:MAG: antibiotic biosynthesis monooxygenase family protein [Crocinitomicaceae bacterium]|jgi:quinol monooxygenase YgiN|tara:strand:+ start:66322 stop:66633 length:312 start_codon:yes stop_codon:yes gene_type:complete